GEGRAAQLGCVHIPIDPHGRSRESRGIAVISDDEDPEVAAFWRGADRFQLHDLGMGFCPGPELIRQRVVREIAIAKRHAATLLQLAAPRSMWVAARDVVAAFKRTE